MKRKILAISLILIISILVPAACQGKKPALPAPVKQEVRKDLYMRFIVMADSRGIDNGVNSNAVNRIMARIKSLSPQPEFIVMPGDLVDGAKSYEQVKKQLSYFKKLVTKYYSAKLLYPGIGNHETAYGTNGEKALAEVFPEYDAISLNGYNRSVYYFDKGGCRFFMLNTDHPGEFSSISQDQLDWLKSNVGPQSRHNFYFFHEPAYPTGPHLGSSLDSNPLQRDKLWQVIDQSKSPLVFCGHEHFYTRRHINSDFNENIRGLAFRYTKDVYQVTVGSFGAPLYSKYSSKGNVDVPPISKFHFAVVDIKADGIYTTVYDINGNTIDSFKVSP